MKYGSIPDIDKPISRLVQGTVALDPADLDAGFALLDSVFEQGCTAIDTAHVYGADREIAIGKWIKERGIREKIVILAKGAHHNNVRNRVTPFDIAADLHDSLARFQTDYFDLYVLHRDDPAAPIGPIVEELNKWKKDGKIRAFGGSNWSWERIREANAYAAQHGLTGFEVSSPNFSLADQIKPPWPGCITISGHSNAAARELYHKAQIPLFCWSSLAGGFFSGRIDRNNLHEFPGGLMKLAVECYASEPNFTRLDRAKEIAREKNATVPQIALSWVMSQPLNIFALVGCQNGDEFKQNAEALGIALTKGELDYLDLKESLTKESIMS
jgi:aryl-alcohol dehydrogenase-like predicted oxidoreductase